MTNEKSFQVLLVYPLKINQKVISKMVMPHILKCWDKSKTQSHPSSIEMTPSEHILLFWGSHFL